MISHALSSNVLILRAYILETTRRWHIQHEFSDCRCDIVCIWYNDNFLTRGYRKKSNLNSFQRVDPGLLKGMFGLSRFPVIFLFMKSKGGNFA